VFVVPAVILAVLMLGVILMCLTLRTKPQHAGAGEGSLSVWELRDRLVAEAAQQASAGRHHLRTFY
jgi:TRAP-type mannitol/chloroaromatic compound transport system permease large subunit